MTYLRNRLARVEREVERQGPREPLEIDILRFVVGPDGPAGQVCLRRVVIHPGGTKTEHSTG